RPGFARGGPAGCQSSTRARTTHLCRAACRERSCSLRASAPTRGRRRGGLRYRCLLPEDRPSWQAPLHRHDAAGVAAAGDDAELGADRRERVRIDVSFFGRFLHVAGGLWTACERVLKKALRALAGFDRLRL